MALESLLSFRLCNDRTFLSDSALRSVQGYGDVCDGKREDGSPRPSAIVYQKDKSLESYVC